MTKLSIVIPYYNNDDYVGELLDGLDAQITPEVQVILVDDGSTVPFKSDYKWLEVIRQENKGCAGARNTGLTRVKGEYVSFIDADDVVAKNFISYIIGKIDTEHFDYMDLSWKSLPGEVGGIHYDYKLNSLNDTLPNPSACTRIFKMSFIGDLRFNAKKRAAEDEEFTRKLDFKGKNRAVATEYMYFYRTTTPNSLSKRYMNGSLGMKRIIYYFKHVTADMTYLIDEFKKTYEESEIFLMTHQNDIPELEKYCSVWEPQPLRGMELRGEPCPFFSLIEMPISCQIAVYTSKTYAIGGIETFLYNFSQVMSKDYDIVILYDTMDEKQIERLKPYARVVKLNPKVPVTCDTLLMNRVFDSIPQNITYKQSIQMVHACSDCCDAKLPLDRDRIIYVSETAKNSWDVDGEVVNNMVLPDQCKSPLFLVSASRFDTPEKGQGRVLKLARLMNEKGIPFIWLYFSNVNLNGCPQNLIRMAPTLDIRGYIRKADYLVQLSDTESFCYSIVEALTEGVPVITTPLPVLKELGVNEKNSHIVPFDIPNDYDVEKIFMERKRGFKYTYDNGKLRALWKTVFDNPKPKEMLKVKITGSYQDMRLNREMRVGEIVVMEKSRALLVQDAGKCKVIE